MTELLPCPFCNGTEIRAQLISSACYCECIDCCARGPVVRPHSMKHQDTDKEKAIEAWNHRIIRMCYQIEKTQPYETYRTVCSICGEMLALEEFDAPNYCPNCGAEVLDHVKPLD